MKKDSLLFTSEAFEGTMFAGVEPPIRENVVAWAEHASATKSGQTVFGIVREGSCELILPHSRHWLTRGCYFAVAAPFDIVGGRGMLITVPDYVGLNVVGGPVEAEGRLKYIDGCMDTLLIPPAKLGDPCLNALYFPPAVDQTAHTHPSVRLGTVLSGRGYCETPEGVFPLEVGMSFCLPAGLRHSFHTRGAPLTVLAYHPDSDFGPEDRNHPMVNRTLVNGVSATRVAEILTP